MLSRRLREACLALLLCLSGATVASATPPRAAATPPRGKRVERVERLTPAQRAAKARAARLGLGTRRAAARLLAGKVEPAWVRAAGSAAPPSVLRQPLAKGWFVRGFGSGAGGYHQAIDIAGQIGWPVRAAASGIVAYAGDEISGYGNMVILVHGGGFITTYAHNSKNRVIPGQLVQRGDIIAEVGSTGRSKGPHVHFELLFNGENCNPAPLFRPGLRRRDGALVPTPKAAWKKANKRPKVITCHPRKHHPNRNPKLEHEEPEDADERTPAQRR